MPLECDEIVRRNRYRDLALRADQDEAVSLLDNSPGPDDRLPNRVALAEHGAARPALKGECSDGWNLSGGVHSARLSSRPDFSQLVVDRVFKIPL